MNNVIESVQHSSKPSRGPVLHSLQLVFTLYIGQLVAAVLGHPELLVSHIRQVCVGHDLFCAGCLKKGLDLAQTQ